MLLKLALENIKISRFFGSACQMRHLSKVACEAKRTILGACASLPVLHIETISKALHRAPHTLTCLYHSHTFRMEPYVRESLRRRVVLLHSEPHHILLNFLMAAAAAAPERASSK